MPSPVSGGLVSIYSQPFELNNDQIKALPTTPFEVVPAITGKVLSFVKAVLFIDIQAGAYTNIDSELNVQFAYSPGGTASSPVLDIANALVDTSVVWWAEVGCKLSLELSADVISNINDLPDVEGQAIRLKAQNGVLGNFTGGHADNRIWGSVSYEIIEV